MTDWQPVSYSETSTFGESLEWHLYVHGTRPTGSPEEEGEVWLKADFVAAANSTVKNVENWLGDKSYSIDISPIEKALFGSNTAYRAWKVQLRKKFQQSKKSSKHKSKQPNPDVGFFQSIPARPLSFTGRDLQISNIHAIFSKATPVDEQLHFRVALHGLPGVGKTALAAEYVYKYREFYDNIWWCAADTRENLVADLARIDASTSADPPADFDPEVLACRILQFFERASHRWLLVFDSINNPNDITDLLPTGNVRTLITSQFSEWSYWAASISVDEISPDHSVEMLLSLSRKDDTKDAAYLSRVLGYLPLALKQAALTCKRNLFTFSEYAAQIEQVLDDMPPSLNYPRSVYATFVLALSNAEKEEPSAGLLMSMYAYCSTAMIPTKPLNIFLENVPRYVLALTILLEYSLIQEQQFDDGTSAVVVHRLVQLVGRIRAEQAGSRNIALTKLYDCIVRSFPTNVDFEETRDTHNCSQICSHLLSYAAFLPNKELTFADTPAVLKSLGSYLFSIGRYNEAESCFSKGLAAYFDCNSTDLILRTQIELGRTRSFHIQGNLADAQYTLSVAVDLLEYNKSRFIDVHGYNKFITAKGVLYAEMGRVLHTGNHLEQAENYFARAIQLFTNANASVSCLLPTSVNLVGTLILLEKYIDAQGVCAEMIGYVISQYGEQDIRLAHVLKSAGSVEVASGNLLRADMFFQRALKIFLSSFGANHPATIRTHYAIAKLASAETDFDKAIYHYDKAISGSDNLHYADNFEVRNLNNNYGRFLHGQKKFEQAELFYRKALTLSIHNKYENYKAQIAIGLQLVQLKLNQAEVYHSIHDNSDKPVQKQSLHIAAMNHQLKTLFHLVTSRSDLGDDHTKNLLKLAVIANYKFQDYKSSYYLLQELYEIYRNVDGDNHIETVKLYWNLAKLSLKALPHDLAVDVIRSATAKMDTSFGKLHPLTRQTASLLANTLTGVGLTDDASHIRAAYNLSESDIDEDEYLLDLGRHESYRNYPPPCGGRILLIPSWDGAQRS